MTIPYKHSWLIVLIASLSIGYLSTHAESHEDTPAAGHIDTPAEGHLNLHANAAPLNVPGSIQTPGDAAYFFETKAGGYQVYRCEADSADGYHWALKSPDATLYDAQGNPFGSHHAGPAWQANDGSHIIGEVKAKVASPDDANSVAWLLVKVKDWGGEGVFNKVTYVNRVNTEGGHAPKDTCNQIHLGDEYRARYTTTYYFYGQP